MSKASTPRTWKSADVKPTHLQFSSPHELRKLAPLLDVAEICVDSLSSVLEDTLDFSKLSNVSEAEEASLRQRRLGEVDLVTLIEGVLTSTWIKKKRADLVSVDLGGMLETERSEQEHQGKIDLILEVDDKQDGWNVRTDVGGLRRILLNIVGVRNLPTLLPRNDSTLTLSQHLYP